MWRLIAIAAAEATANDLTHRELIALARLVDDHAGAPDNPRFNIYRRAWLKILPQVGQAVRDGQVEE